MSEKTIFGKTTQKTVTIHVKITHYVNDMPVITVSSETEDGFIRSEVDAIINYFQGFIKESEVEKK
jgi:hypothetical protein